MKKHDVVPEEAWNMLLSLPSHVDDFKANGNYGNIELMAMGASQFSLTQELFDKDFVAAMYARVSNQIRSVSAQIHSDRSLPTL